MLQRAPELSNAILQEACGTRLPALYRLVPRSAGSSAVSSRAPRLLCAVLALAAVRCGKDAAPAPGVGSGRRPMSEQDGGTDPDPQPSPRPDGGAILPEADEELVLPFLGPEQRIKIEIDAQPRVLDVHFSVDTTSSELGEIRDLQRS